MATLPNQYDEDAYLRFSSLGRCDGCGRVDVDCVLFGTDDPYHSAKRCRRCIKDALERLEARKKNKKRTAAR